MALQRAAQVAAVTGAAYLFGSYAVRHGYLPAFDTKAPPDAERGPLDEIHAYNVWEIEPDQFAPVGGKAATHTLYRHSRTHSTPVSYKDRAGGFQLWISDGSRQISPKGEACFKCIGAERYTAADTQRKARVEQMLWDRMMDTVQAAGVTTLYGTSHTPTLSERMAAMGFVVEKEDYDGASTNGVRLDMTQYKKYIDPAAVTA
jgi:hypothetical protein